MNLDSPVKLLNAKLSGTRQQMIRFFKCQNEQQDGSVVEKYRERLFGYLQRHHLGASLAELSDIFVEPRILIPQEAWDSNHQKSSDLNQLIEFWPDLLDEVAFAPPPSCTVRQLLLQGDRVVISGRHGTGKTTLLAYLALLCLNNKPFGKHDFMKETLPVFLHLTEFGCLNLSEENADEGRDNDPMAILSETLLDRFDNIEHKALDSLLRSKVAQGKFLLLIDGMDELSPKSYAPYVKWLDQFLTVYPYCQVIITGPAQGLGPLISMGFTISGLLAWRKGQVEAFYEAWSSPVTSGMPKLPGNYWRPGQTTLQTFLRFSLCLHEESVVSIGSYVRNVDLLEYALVFVLNKIRLINSDGWLRTATREFWQYLAFTTMKRGQLITSEAEIREIARTALQSFLADIDESAINKLLETVRESGIFVNYPNGKYGFMNPEMRDYLAAVYIARSRERDHAGDYFDNQYWSGVLKYVVGRIGAMSLLKQLHASGRKLTTEDLFTLAEWLPEALDHHQWRRQVLIGLGQYILNQENPFVLRQRAIVLLAKSGEEGVSDLLTQLLSMQETAIQQTVVAAFARVSPADAIPINERMLSTAEENIRVAAIHSLAWIDVESAEKPLVKALLEPDTPVKEAAAVALALNGSTASREILREALAEKLTSVRLATVHALAEVEEEWSTKLLTEVFETDEHHVVKSAAEKALLRQKEPSALAIWRPARAGEQQWLIDWALDRGEIVPVGPAAVRLIIEALSDTEANIRKAAIRTLAALCIKEATDPVAQLLTDPDAEVRSAAVYACRRLNEAWGVAQQ